MTHDAHSLGPLCIKCALRPLRSRPCEWGCRRRILNALPVVPSDAVAELSEELRGRGPPFLATASTTVLSHPRGNHHRREAVLSPIAGDLAGTKIYGDTGRWLFGTV